MAFVWIVFLLFPLATLLHELGHYITARSLHIKQVRIILGIGPPLFRISNRFIKLEVRTLYFIGGFTNTESNQLSNNQKALISVNGPLVNAVVGCYGWLYLNRVLTGSNIENLLFLFTMINTWIAIGNLIPYKLGSKKSDGYIAFEMILDYTKGKRIAFVNFLNKHLK
ncbi:site-2 protease family protein [Pseudalkalibacillus decolorationis]|uniref:site-2 protease family protein n=1 Tax=Pseudalkalibacillus decolorationis TaxID=163879 RepID=UPI002148188F|nr:site-2 protease family protein [Pseudalkalibacillus decolorationis]